MLKDSSVNFVFRSFGLKYYLHQGGCVFAGAGLFVNILIQELLKLVEVCSPEGFSSFKFIHSRCKNDGSEPNAVQPSPEHTHTRPFAACAYNAAHFLLHYIFL